LTWLELTCQFNISDWTPLSGLTNLTSLVLFANNINDLTPLSGLVNLEFIDLRDNPIADWAPVAHVPEVRGRPEDLNS